MHSLPYPQYVLEVAQALSVVGGRAFVVGGAVRDRFLGIKAVDFDLEVYGLELDDIRGALSKLGALSLIGKQFPVFLLVMENGEKIELSLPRSDSKTGPGHRGFEVVFNPYMEKKEAALRRDFTVNAMLEDPLSLELFDFYGGISDLKNKVLRHVSTAFSEDPLRVLRAGRFVAKTGFSIADETISFCKEINLNELPVERVENEFRGMLCEGRYPGDGLLALEACGALKFFSELEELRNVPQDPKWHPEGDVLTHTALSLNAAVLRKEEMQDVWVEMLGVLCHDLGKPLTTVLDKGRWRSPKHDVLGVGVTKLLLEKINTKKDVIPKVCDLVREHLRVVQLYTDRDKVSDAAIRRLSTRVDLQSLCRVAFADFAGRGESVGLPWPPEQWLLARASSLGVKEHPPIRFLRGQDLVDAGVPPGPEMGKILAESYRRQISGEILTRDDALKWLLNR